MKALILVLCWFGANSHSFAHGRSEGMTGVLSEPVPDWLAIGEPIKVIPSEHESEPNSQTFFPRSGGATNSRNVIKIPDREIELKVPYEIDWRGLSEEGYGVSLNPEGTRLIVNTGMTTRLYDLSSSGEFQEIPIKVPHVTYDQGAKGFILGWSWAGEGVLVGRATITDDSGHNIVENRLYLFHLKEGVLSRLDLSALKLSEGDLIEVAAVGSDLSQMKLKVEGSSVVVKGDWRAPTKILPGEHRNKSPGTSKLVGNDQPRPPKQAVDSREETNPQNRMLGIAIILLIVFALLFFLSKLRARRKQGNTR